MKKLACRAEIRKLALTLELSPQQLQFLEVLDPAEIREFRERASAALFDDMKPRLQRVAQASRLLPAAVNALIGEKVFGAMLCARVAGLLPAAQALDTARRLPTGFLADVSIEIDPRSTREIIARLPPETVLAIARELIGRKEFIVMARFVDFLLDSTLALVIHSIHDDAVLLQVASFLESPQRIDQIVGFMSRERLGTLIETAARGGEDAEGYWDQALGLMTMVGEKTRELLAEVAAERDEAVLNSMIEAVQRQDLWEALLPILQSMSQKAQQKLARMVLAKGVKAELLREKARSLGVSKDLEAVLAAIG